MKANVRQGAWLWLCLLLPMAAQALPRCLFVSSYHQGYAWSDGVQRGLEAALDGRCELRQFDMDTKRHKSEAEKRAAAEAALRLIREWRPDVLITADDNAARYLVKPHLKDAELPVVFCGINWSVEEYGFPYRNVTGMIEVAPVKAMLRQARRLSGNGDDFFYLGANTTTERKNLERFRRAARELGLEVEARLVDDFDAWAQAYREAQRYPFLALGSHAGIRDWDFARARSVALASARVPSVTNHRWMMPVSMLGFTKIPEEQGRWAGEAALAILDGLAPSEIPIVANRRWDLWVNAALLQAAGIELPTRLRDKAKAWEVP